jgi:hypothetical protein
MMFVLTEKEGNSSKPVGTCSEQGTANAWAARSRGNDYYAFEVDQLDHLDFAFNGPEYEPAPRPVEGFRLPEAPPEPTLDDMKELSRSLHGVLEEMEAMQRMLQASLGVSA